MRGRYDLIIFCMLFEFLLCAAQKKHGTAIFNDPCKRDVDCIENAFCRGQQICQCEQFYAPSPDRTTCIATAGLSCEDDSTCITMSNAICRQNVCACKDSFTLDINNSSNCINRPAKEGDHCQKMEDCEEAMERAMCINNKCRCINGYRFVNETEKCIRALTLYNTCKNDYECFLDDGTAKVLICKNGECVCKEGDPRCNKGSVVTSIIELIISTILVLQIA